jgi:hypothetical protein
MKNPLIVPVKIIFFWVKIDKILPKKKRKEGPIHPCWYVLMLPSHWEDTQVLITYHSINDFFENW